jgi:hypothetical protein
MVAREDQARGLLKEAYHAAPPHGRFGLTVVAWLWSPDEALATSEGGD